MSDIKELHFNIMVLHFKIMKLYFFYKKTPLHFACEAGYIDIVDLLIENGAEINARADAFQA